MSVDWRQLQRWNIPESALPAGTLVLHREPTLWQRYWQYIIAISAVIAVQTLLIVGLLWQRARRRKAESAIRESEAAFPARHQHGAGDDLDVRSRSFVQLLQQAVARFHRAAARRRAGRPAGRRACIRKTDGHVWRHYARAFDLRESFQLQYRLRRHDGEFRWIFDIGRAAVQRRRFLCRLHRFLPGHHGTQAGRRGAGQRRRQVDRWRRSRNALALRESCTTTSTSNSRSCRCRSTNSARIHQIRSLRSRPGSKRLEVAAADISTSVNALSHRLHSSKLEYLGLVAALRSFCREFSEQHHVDVTFSHDPIPDELAAGDLAVPVPRRAGGTGQRVEAQRRQVVLRSPEVVPWRDSSERPR